MIKKMKIKTPIIKDEEIVEIEKDYYFRATIGTLKNFKSLTGKDFFEIVSKGMPEEEQFSLLLELPAFLWLKNENGELKQNASTANEALNSVWYNSLTMNDIVEIIKYLFEELSSEIKEEVETSKKAE